MGCPVFDNIGANIISPFAFFWLLPTVYRLLFFALFFSKHFAFRQTHKKAGISEFCHPTAPARNLPKIHPPQKKFPGAGPRAYRICNTVCKTGGLAPGKVWAGEAPEGPASPKGFTGWGGTGAACGSPLADFSSGE